MRPSVLAALWGFTKGLEGYVDQMYADVLGLVTTGCGNLIDPEPLASQLPWLHRADDTPATVDEIALEWHAVKDGRINAYQGLRPLYLPAQAVAALVLLRFRQNEVYLSRRWARWADWPADAQLGAHSCAWAAGAQWTAPKFDAAAALMSADGFMTIAGPPGDANVDISFRGEAWLRDGPVGSAATTNAGLRHRNLDNKTCFQNASRVLTAGSDPDELHWPAVLEAP